VKEAGMEKKANKKKKSFISRLIDKLDKKMEEKAKKTPCCDSSAKKKGSSCC